MFHFVFPLFYEWLQIGKPRGCCHALECAFLMKCYETKNKYSGCFYLKPRTGEWKGGGSQPDLPDVCVWTERGRVNKREREREGAVIFWTC